MRVGGWGEKSALLLDALLEVQQALHVEIRPQKCEREAGGLDRRFNHAVVAKKSLRGARIGMKL